MEGINTSEEVVAEENVEASSINRTGSTGMSSMKRIKKDKLDERLYDIETKGSKIKRIVSS